MRFEDLRVRDQQALDRDFFNRRFRLIAESIGQLGDAVQSVTTDTDRLVALGLIRVNEVLGPLLSKLQAVADLGFLVAKSATALTVSNGLQSTLTIDDQAERELFTPTPYVLLTRDADGAENDYAILRVEQYIRDTGGLAFTVVSINGNIGNGPHSDWVISATAGISASILEAAASVQETLALAQQAALDAAAAVAAAEEIISTGAVSKVNGKTGIVVIGMSDIAGLTSALGSKADSSHGHVIADITGLEAALLSATDGGTY